MEWYVIVGLVVFILTFIYRFISAKPRKAANLIGQKINVKPGLIELMYNSMGKDKGLLFVECTADHNEIEQGAYTFVIFEILKNPSDQNIKWWKERLVESGLIPNITFDITDTAFMYLRDFVGHEVDVNKFVEGFNGITTKYD